MIEDTLVEMQAMKPNQEDIYDLIIIGAGAAGISAAICACRANLNVCVLEKALPGGQVSTAYRISNLPGYPEGILGDNLARNMEAQLNDHTYYYSGEGVSDISDQGSFKTVHTELGAVYKAKSVLIAVGLEPKELNTDFEKSFVGRGISYYAQGDVDTYKGQDVAVIGGGNCACYAADYLAQYVNKLYLIHRSDNIKAVKKLKNRIFDNPKIDVMWDSDVEDVFGIDNIEKIKVRNVVNNQYTWIDVRGMFVYVGRIPPAVQFNMKIDTDDKGFIVTDQYMRTSVPGIYAAGDIRVKQIRQIATAISDGMVAAINIDRDLQR